MFILVSRMSLGQTVKSIIEDYRVHESGALVYETPVGTSGVHSVDNWIRIYEADEESMRAALKADTLDQRSKHFAADYLGEDK